MKQRKHAQRQELRQTAGSAATDSEKRESPTHVVGREDAPGVLGQAAEGVAHNTARRATHTHNTSSAPAETEPSRIEEHVICLLANDAGHPERGPVAPQLAAHKLNHLALREHLLCTKHKQSVQTAGRRNKHAVEVRFSPQGHRARRFSLARPLL